MPLITPEPDEVGDVAAALLRQAGGDASRVRTVTTDGRLAFDVDDDLIADTEPEADKPVRRTRKRRTTTEQP